MDNYQEQGTGRRSHGKAKKKSNLLSNILIVVGVALLLVAGGMWGAAQLRYLQQDREIAKLTIYAKVNDTEQGDEVSQAPEVDWEGLKAINPDVIAWIQIPGTEINYPVYEANDNEKYLHTSATGEYAFGGVLFADYECTRPGMQDPSTLIYGHHLLNGTMFKAIADMDNQEAFDAIDTVWYVTEQQAYECEPLALYYTQDTDMTVRKFKFESLDAFHAYLGERVSKAVVARSDAAQLVPRISHALNLITCNYYDGYGRTVLICVPKAEAAGQVAGEITTSPQSATPSGEIVEEVPAEESVEEPVEEEVVEEEVAEEEWVEE
ncbi:MAG: class B sortase [Atopobiaceae bacterium]|nr:class B sortase [Atopobiaceae bacterium]